MEEALRIQQLPPYLFARIERKIDEMKAEGKDVISLGIGDPDQPTPDLIVQELCRQAQLPQHHQYPSSVGMLDFRKAVAEWYKQRFNVDVDSKNEVVTLIGSKEGIAHISWCYVNPGDYNLVPDPGYPVYGIGTLLAGGQAYPMQLKEENGFLPDFAAIPKDIAKKAKLMFLNYPNNPTGAEATLEFFREAVDYAREHDLIICHDAAYSEIYFGEQKPPSILQVEGAKDVAIEFGSLSKPYNMTGWRIGWAVGNSRVIDALGRIKSNLDSGQFQAVQAAGIVALKQAEDKVSQMRKLYAKRAELVTGYLREMGWKIKQPTATFYIWVPVPEGFSSTSFVEHVLEKSAVVLTAGNGYGQYGEGYFRISLTLDTERLKEAMERLRAVL